MIFVTFYLHKAKSPITPIYVRVHPGDFRASTHLSVEPKYWALKGKKISRGMVVNKWLKSEHPYSIEWNKHLRELNDKIHHAYSEQLKAGRSLSDVDLRELIKPGSSKKSKKDHSRPVTVKEWCELWSKRYLERKNRGNKSGVQIGTDYARRYKQVVSKLEEFMPNIRPEQVNEEVLEAFEEWVMNHKEYKVQDSSISRYRKVIKAALMEAGLPHEWIRVGKAAISTKYDLTWEEVLKLKDAAYSKESLRRVAHTFVIQCQLGLRYGDLVSLRDVHRQQVKVGKYGEVTVINKTQGKTGDEVYIPIPEMAVALIELHEGIPVIRTKQGKISLQKYNKYLKDAASEAGLNRLVRKTRVYYNHVEETQVPLHEILSSHDARHTGASRILTVTKDAALVKKFLGHASGDVTDIYSHYNPVVVAEHLLDAWQAVDDQYRKEQKNKKANS